MLPAGKYVVEVVVPAGYRTGQGRGQEHPHRRQLHRARDAAIWRAGIASSSCPTRRRLRAAYNANNAQNSDQQPGPQSGLPSHESDTGLMSKPTGPASASRASFLTTSASSRSRRKSRRSPGPRATSAIVRKLRLTIRLPLSPSSTSSPRPTPPRTSPASSPMTSPRSSIRSRRSSVRSSRRPICRYRSRIGPAMKSTVCTPMQWGVYNGLNYSTWEVNPPNPTGYSPDHDGHLHE